MLLPDEYEITVGSYRMNINPKEDLGLYFGYKEVEPGFPDLLKKIIKKGELFIDVGAYKGFYSLIASELVGEDGKVLAFEPNYKSFEILVKNIKLNSISNIIALNIALSDFDGRASFVNAGD
ncbi:MAG: FkbM family methyltransferase [Candidatus Micrarchaeota archaeon]|nr:FkbM family methyltransferase [Candidatus Micrarchaeota archaeon]